jgi:hypothetical protein
MKDKQLREQLFFCGILDENDRPTINFRNLEKAINKSIVDAREAIEISRDNATNINNILGWFGLRFEKIGRMIHISPDRDFNDRCKVCGRE